MSNGPKVLLLDIETSPIEAYVWALWDQTVGLNQIKKDWFILAWSAKWLGSEKIFYQDQRKARKKDLDKKLITPLWKLMDKADILVTQNGIKFDARKLNARFVINGMKPPSSYRHRDTKRMAAKHFGFTSNSLEYLCKALGCKFQKLKTKKFQGMELWTECLKGNAEAWEEMEEYNKRDVLALESLYEKLSAWDTSVNFNVYHDREDFVCQCGHPAFQRYGHAYANGGRYQRFKCKRCGAEYRSKDNLLSKEKRTSLKVGK